VSPDLEQLAVNMLVAVDGGCRKGQSLNSLCLAAESYTGAESLAAIIATSTLVWVARHLLQVRRNPFTGSQFPRFSCVTSVSGHYN
jgi:hypothetical protein